MTSCLLIGDIHVSDKPPISRTPTYLRDILDKLKFCVETANDLRIPIVQGGDVFHIKAASRNSYRLVQKVHDILKKAERGVWIVPGNHDLAYDRLDSLPSQPLGALCRMENVHLLIGEDENLPGIAGVPYISQFDGGWWQGHLRDYWENFDIDTPELLVTHAPIFPPGQAPEVYASIEPDDWAEYWIGVPATFYSHIHDYHGVFMDPNGYMQFCNQGALSRGSLHESSVTRKPAVTLWDDGEFKRIEVPHKPAEEVFLFEQAAAKQRADVAVVVRDVMSILAAGVRGRRRPPPPRQ